ncbi:uncharacterized protein [Lolium perenne]|uniref:uncharacterized protein isoform X2 n=1 Tax=Lolium perenne TaxID=4522 RepID=UPI0021F63C07|nr:uncharacterized protein LOC127299904 isoform X2 [Lolium perenne]
MVGGNPRSKPQLRLAVRLRPRPIPWRIVVKNLISNGPMLAPLPQSCPTQPNFNNIPTQGINQNMAEQFSIFLDSAKEMMGNLFGRLDGVCTSLKESSESMKQLTGVIAEREEGSKKRHEERKRKDLDMCIGMKNGDVMYVDEPSQSQTGNLFDKQKRTVKEMGFWLQNRATVEDLNGPWIQFQDNPRFTIDGNYINKFVNTEVDVDQKMAFAIARLLNRGPGKQEADSGFTCHFLLHDWAAKALHDSSTTEDCIPLFDRHGLKKSKLVKCNKIVPFVLLGGKWLSVSIDIPGRSTTLIHPTAAQRPVNEVEEQFKPMCHRLTKFALSNISALTMKNIKHEHWSYNVALREEHTFTPNNAGAIAFYYSIPRENQFMAVSDAPVTNVKMNFVHELIKMCSKTTNKTVKRCAIRNPPAPPAPPAPKVLKAADQGDGRALKRPRKQKEKLEDGDCSESGSCSKNEFD